MSAPLPLPPTSPYRSYATPPSTPSPSNPITTHPPNAHPRRPNPRRTPHNPTRPLPTLRREPPLFGEDSALGGMVLCSAGVARIGLIHLGLAGEAGREELTESQLGEVGVRGGWMVGGVGEDAGSQFTQGSDASQLFDSQPQLSQPRSSFDTPSLYQLPSAPIIRERGGSSSRSGSRQPPAASPSRLRSGARRDRDQSSPRPGSSTGRTRTGFGSSGSGSTRLGLGALLEDGES